MPPITYYSMIYNRRVAQDYLIVKINRFTGFEIIVLHLTKYAIIPIIIYAYVGTHAFETFGT